MKVPACRRIGVKKLRGVLVGCTASLAGCAWVQSFAPATTGPVTASSPMESLSDPFTTASVEPRQFDYSYELLAREETGISRVFDDERVTYLQFESAAPAALLLFNQDGQAVNFEIHGAFVVVNAVHRGLLIRTPSQQSYAAPRDSERVARIEAGRAGDGLAGARYLPPELASARAQVMEAQQRLTKLSGELDKALKGAPSMELAEIRGEIDQIAIRIGAIEATLVRISFPIGGATLVLSNPTRDAISLAARRARSVIVRGRTDSTGSVAVNAHIARARALAARSMLLDAGVEPRKISLQHRGLNDYVGSNATEEGRARNRRVDIVLVGHGGDRVRVGLRNDSPVTSPFTVMADSAAAKASRDGDRYKL